MYRHQTRDMIKKTTIANDYLLPKIREQSLQWKILIFQKKHCVILLTQYTDSESGVRNLKRCLKCYTKLNLYRLMKPGTNLFEKDMSLM